MSPTSQPIDREVLSGFRLGDERSLERLFRERFAALTDEARSEFGDSPSGPAPRIVERAFVRAWEERTRFETPESLDAFLHESVHDGIVRERSRRAALHRFEAHDALHGAGAARGAPAGRTIETIPLDEAWQHVAKMLHRPVADAEVRHRALDESRHHAAEHLAATGRSRPLAVPLATAGVIAAVVLGGLWWVDRNSEDAAVSNALSSPEARVITSGAGQIGSTTLRDGSIVKLGPDTKLTVSPSYGTTLRALKLEGAASFNVRDGLKEPFAVRVRDVIVRATGTAFDVTAFPADPRVVVRVREGSVTVKGDGDLREVAAGQAVAVDRDGTVTDAAGPAVDEAVAWADGKFAVANRPLREVLPMLTRWYRIDLQVRDPALLDRRVTANASLESSREAIAAIEKSTGLKFDYEGKTMVLRDPGAAPAPAPKR